MRLSFLPAGFVLVIFAASHCGAQTTNLPPSPRVMQMQSLADVGYASGASVRFSAPVLNVFAQEAPSTDQNASAGNDQPICGISHLVRCIRDLGEDEKGILTSPFRLQTKDVYWLAPLGAATGLAFAYDADAAQAAGVDPGRANTANKIADFGSWYASGAEGAGIYFIGLAKRNPKLAETGRLGVEAILDSGIVTLGIKLITNRQRPDQGNGQGDFWASGSSRWGYDSSFPSDHATATMSLARVIAGEYPHWYVVVPAYGFAESVSISRILANQHFPSDIVVGQAIGFLTGTYVLDHRALYRPGRHNLATRVIGSLNPIADARTRTLGASVQIPLAR